jgi:hypothetical protein
VGVSREGGEARERLRFMEVGAKGGGRKDTPRCSLAPLYRKNLKRKKKKNDGPTGELHGARIRLKFSPRGYDAAGPLP